MQQCTLFRLVHSADVGFGSAQVLLHASPDRLLDNGTLEPVPHCRYLASMSSAALTRLICVGDARSKTAHDQSKKEKRGFFETSKKPQSHFETLLAQLQPESPFRSVFYSAV